MKPGAATKSAVRSPVRALGGQSEYAPRRSAARQIPLLIHHSNTSPSMDPDVHIFAKGYLAGFMDTTAEVLTFASFSANDRENAA
jgi:hypothetical protein